MLPLEPWLILSRLLILLFTAFIAWLTYQSNLLLKEIDPTVNILLSWPETVARILLVGICLVLAWLTGLPPQTLGFTVENLWWSIAIGVAAGTAILLAINFTSEWAIGRFGRQIYSPRIIRNILPRRRIEWLWVALAFIPPITMEELLFRSLLIGAFQQIVPLGLLILTTSAVFGFMHAPQGKLGIILAGSINVVFGVLFVWTGELLVPLVAHYTVNMLQLVVARWGPLSKSLSGYELRE